MTWKFSNVFRALVYKHHARKNENAVTAISKGRPTTINEEEYEAVKKAINAGGWLTYIGSFVGYWSFKDFSSKNIQRQTENVLCVHTVGKVPSKNVQNAEVVTLRKARILTCVHDFDIWHAPVFAYLLCTFCDVSVICKSFFMKFWMQVLHVGIISEIWIHSFICSTAITFVTHYWDSPHTNTIEDKDIIKNIYECQCGMWLCY